MEHGIFLFPSIPHHLQAYVFQRTLRFRERFNCVQKHITLMLRRLLLPIFQVSLLHIGAGAVELKLIPYSGHWCCIILSFRPLLRRILREVKKTWKALGI